MTNLSDELNVSPRRRITIPEGHIAIVLPSTVADDVREMCFLLRKSKRFTPEDKKAVHGIAGDLLLAIIEGEM